MLICLQFSTQSSRLRSYYLLFVINISSIAHVCVVYSIQFYAWASRKCTRTQKVPKTIYKNKTNTDYFCLNFQNVVLFLNRIHLCRILFTVFFFIWLFLFTLPLAAVHPISMLYKIRNNLKDENQRNRPRNEAKQNFIDWNIYKMLLFLVEIWVRQRQRHRQRLQHSNTYWQNERILYWINYSDRMAKSVRTCFFRCLVHKLHFNSEDIDDRVLCCVLFFHLHYNI